jgi:DNA ligase D-like protein (predicted ligase)
MAELPRTIQPMLAEISEPFDSDEHVFEIKWDGIRIITFVDAPGEYRLQNRRLTDVRRQYPELREIGDLPPGTALDGEIVILVDGKPDFQLMQKRWNVHAEREVARLASVAPATFVAFDLLYDDFGSLLRRPLSERRDRLAARLDGRQGPRLAFSDGVVGAGIALYRQAFDSGLEGIIGKRLTSRYLPGRRSAGWQKVKCRKLMHCAIIGFLPEGDADLKSLIVAAPDESGKLRSVGRVGSGLTETMRVDLARRLRARLREEPIVATPHAGLWVEPGIFCTVEYSEVTRAGDLRAPVFKELIEG